MTLMHTCFIHHCYLKQMAFVGGFGSGRRRGRRGAGVYLGTRPLSRIPTGCTVFPAIAAAAAKAASRSFG